MLVQQFASNAQQPTIAPIGSHISPNYSNNEQQAQDVPKVKIGFPTIDNSCVLI